MPNKGINIILTIISSYMIASNYVYTKENYTSIYGLVAGIFGVLLITIIILVVTLIVAIKRKSFLVFFIPFFVLPIMFLGDVTNFNNSLNRSSEMKKDVTKKLIFLQVLIIKK